jgi:hypothetical protein
MSSAADVFHSSENQENQKIESHSHLQDDILMNSKNNRNGMSFRQANQDILPPISFLSERSVGSESNASAGSNDWLHLGLAQSWTLNAHSSGIPGKINSSEMQYLGTDQTGYPEPLCRALWFVYLSIFF